MTQIIGWIGVLFGVSVSIPQISKSLRERSVRGVSKRTYQLLFVAIVCYLIRAIGIGAPVFIVGNSIGLALCSTMLYLFRRFKDDTKGK